MPVGDAIIVGRELPPAVIQTMGPRQAMAEALSAYLLRATFSVDGGTAAPTKFQLRSVFPEWPDSSTELPYPCASLIEKTDTFYEAHNFVPTAQEGTLGQFDCLAGYPPPPVPGQAGRTVLWKLAEATLDFQLDFWLSNIPQREAIGGSLGELFNPGEARTGVLVVGPERYYSLPVRATLMAHRRMDANGTVYPNERRLMATVHCEMDVVQLRVATLLSPEAAANVVDPSDPPEEN